MRASEVSLLLDGEVAPYEAATVSAHEQFVYVNRLDIRGPGSQIAGIGPHFAFCITQVQVCMTLERRRSDFQFNGPMVGHMEELGPLFSRTGGQAVHAISSLAATLSVLPKEDRVAFEFKGALVYMPQWSDVETPPCPRSSFDLKLAVPFAMLAELFEFMDRKEATLARHLARHPDNVL